MMDLNVRSIGVTTAEGRLQVINVRELDRLLSAASSFSSMQNSILTG